jgi:hypothetical protein
MQANVSIQATLNNTANNFVVSWQLASGGGIIGSIAPTKPYGSPFQVNIPSLTPNVTYIITLWESTSTAPTGTVRNATNVIPSATTTTIRADDYLTADITAGLVNNTNSYVNVTYAGWNYDLERVGQGTLYPDSAPDALDPDYHQDATGGFTLLHAGDVWGANEKLVVKFQPQVAPAAAATVGVITTGVVITADTALDATYLNEAIFLQGSGSVLNITLPALSSVGDYKFMYFYSAGGSHISAPITAAGTDKYQRRTQVSKIVLNQNEVLKIFKANGVWCIDYLSPTVDMVGEIIYKMTNTDFNYLYADGSLVSRTQYARLFDYVNSNSGLSVTEVNWGSSSSIDGIIYHLNKGFYTLGTNTSNFRLPRLSGQFIRGAGIGDDGIARSAGEGKNDAMAKHKHSTLIGNLPTSPNGKGPTANIGNYNNQKSTPEDLTSEPYMDPGAGNVGNLMARVDTKTYPENVAEYAIIRI